MKARGTHGREVKLINDMHINIIKIKFPKHASLRVEVREPHSPRRWRPAEALLSSILVHRTARRAVPWE